MYIVLDSMYETMSISTGLYPNLNLWNTNKLHYINFYKCFQVLRNKLTLWATCKILDF